MRRTEGGFTLIEAVLVLVLLGTLSAGLATFIDQATDHYIDTAERTRLLGEARLALGRVGREIQGALPHSVRRAQNTSGDTTCVEFLPLVEGGRYQDQEGTYSSGEGRRPLPVGGNGAPFHAPGFSGVRVDGTATLGMAELDAVGVRHVAVYPVPPADDYIYAGNDEVALRDVGDPANFAGPGDPDVPTGVVEVPLAAGESGFPRHAPVPRRFFLTEGPVSFCLEGSDLMRYEDAGYNIQPNQPVPPAVEGRPLARNLGAGSELELEPAGLQRRGLLRLRLVLERRDDKNEPVEVEHAFAVRNRP